MPQPVAVEQREPEPAERQDGQEGREDAERRSDLRGLWAFNPVAADAEHPAGCRYVAEARHRLCGEFRPYWEGHGLEFGDDGVTFRESLALFGYPISEEFIDPATGLITQYFERAVFEYHAGLGSSIPARRSVAYDEKIMAKLPPKNWRAYYESIEAPNARPVPSPPEYNTVESIFRRHLGVAFANEQPVKAAMCTWFNDGILRNRRATS